MRVFACLLFLLFSGGINTVWAQKTVVLSGYVREEGSRENLAGANLWVAEQQTGTTTNAYGFFSLQLPSGSYSLRISYVGYETKNLSLQLDSSENQIIYLTKAYNLQEVVVTDDGILPVSEQVQMSQLSLSAEQIKNTPTLLGEKDVMKTLQLLPGIQSGSEGQSGLYVRGGGPDQNLILVDEATVYNASHLFGFFSVFNGDAVKNVTLTKGGFPARYGGRLSSVVDISMKEGDQSTYKGEIGVGLISARATVEGPIIKDKASFIISARRTYYDLLLAPFLSVGSLGTVSSGYYFYDFNAKINYQLNRRNRLYLSTYTGKDRFFSRFSFDDEAFNSDFDWGNVTATLRWNHQYSDKVFLNTSLILSDYKLKTENEFSSGADFFSLQYYSAIRDLSLKFDADILYSNRHRFRVGAQSTRHLFTPSATVLQNSFVPESDFKNVLDEPSLENAVYIEDNIQLNRRLDLLLGLRVSHFYAQGRHYGRPEPRISSRYRIDSTRSVKMSYSAMNQYLHLLSNTGIGLPTDLWVPATERVGPQRAQQIALGYAQDWSDLGISLEVETYYKRSTNVLAYLPGASFLLDGLEGLFESDPDNSPRSFEWEDQVTSGQADAYGIEIFLQKPQGKFNGWLGYTLSKTSLTFEELNFGNPFPARYDRRHDVSLNTFYHIQEPQGKSNGVKLSAVFVFGTGNAITIPKGEFWLNPFQMNGQSVNPSFMFTPPLTDYGNLNDYRMASYHRLDLGVQFTKYTRRGERTFDISIYNVYNRMNPWMITTAYEDNRTIFVQYSLFGILPTVTYSLKF